jgi:hypothetical protein
VHEVKMSDYAKFLSEKAARSNFAFLNLQPVFGSPSHPEKYGPKGKPPLFTDFAHPNNAGGDLVSKEIERALLSK